MSPPLTVPRSTGEVKAETKEVFSTGRNMTVWIAPSTRPVMIINEERVTSPASTCFLLGCRLCPPRAAGKGHDPPPCYVQGRPEGPLSPSLQTGCGESEPCPLPGRRAGEEMLRARQPVSGSRCAGWQVSPGDSASPVTARGGAAPGKGPGTASLRAWSREQQLRPDRAK